MLKKIIALTLTLLLTSCSTQGVSTEDVSLAFQNDFSCSAKVLYSGDETEFEIEKKGLSISFNIVSPAEMAGLCLTAEEGELSLVFEGAEVKLDLEKIPAKSPMKLFCSLLEILSLPDEFTAVKNGGEIKITGKNFSASLDPENLGLLSAKFPAEDVEFSFSEWAFSGKM